MTRLILCLLIGIGFIESADAEDGAEPMKIMSDAGVLLSHLDLDAPGLEEVKKAAGNPEAAARKLLAYYRSRDSVKHSVDREQRSAMLGKSASKKNLEVADNALQHIFVGQRNYPPHFCGEDINWNTRPVPDTEWVHQLNRMYFWNDMALAYWHTGDEKYAREWCAQVLDWTKKNPRDNKHNHAWRSIEAGIRGRMWTGLFQRFLDSPSFTPDVLTAFLNSCHDHGSFLMTTYRKGSNWALMEAEGLAFIAITFPEFRDATKWRDEAIRRLNREVKGQIHADGHQRELAIGYHIGAIGWFMRTLDMANMNGQKDAFPPSYLQTIEKMCAVVMKLGLPDGSKTQFGDSWTGKPGDNWPRSSFCCCWTGTPPIMPSWTPLRPWSATTASIRPSAPSPSGYPRKTIWRRRFSMRDAHLIRWQFMPLPRLCGQRLPPTSPRRFGGCSPP